MIIFINNEKYVSNNEKITNDNTHF